MEKQTFRCNKNLALHFIRVHLWQVCSCNTVNILTFYSRIWFIFHFFVYFVCLNPTFNAIIEHASMLKYILFSGLIARNKHKHYDSIQIWSKSSLCYVWAFLILIYELSSNGYCIIFTSRCKKHTWELQIKSYKSDYCVMLYIPHFYSRLM